MAELLEGTIRFILGLGSRPGKQETKLHVQDEERPFEKQ
jgi:hypothetical protein